VIITGEKTLKRLSELPIKYQWHILRIYTLPHFSYLVNGDKNNNNAVNCCDKSFALKLRNKLFGQGFIATYGGKRPLAANQKSERGKDLHHHARHRFQVDTDK